jgi:hypothetical protein
MTSEFPSPSIVDSRRLMGPNLYSDHMGVVLEVTLDPHGADSLLGGWASQASLLAELLGGSAPELYIRPENGTATLFLAAPVDALMAATEVNEQAWVLAEAASSSEVKTSLIARLRAAIDAERATKPHLAAVYNAAIDRGLDVTFDDESFTIGSGSGSQTWALEDIPAVADIDWDAVHDVPIALVTGSNGKTTTTRLVAAMWRAAGRETGWSCSDGVWVGDEQLEQGDYSGPAGARIVLRMPRSSPTSRPITSASTALRTCATSPMPKRSSPVRSVIMGRSSSTRTIHSSSSSRRASQSGWRGFAWPPITPRSMRKCSPTATPYGCTAVESFSTATTCGTTSVPSTRCR